MRVSQASDVVNLPYVNSLLPGARAWVDNNGAGLWEVIEKQATDLQILKTIIVNTTSLNSNATTLESQIKDTTTLLTQIDKKIIDSMALLDTCAECGQALTDEAKIALIEGVSEHATC